MQVSRRQVTSAIGVAPLMTNFLAPTPLPAGPRSSPAFAAALAAYHEASLAIASTPGLDRSDEEVDKGCDRLNSAVIALIMAPALGATDAFELLRIAFTRLMEGGSYEIDDFGALPDVDEVSQDWVDFALVAAALRALCGAPTDASTRVFL